MFHWFLNTPLICGQIVKEDGELNEIGSRWSQEDEEVKLKKHPMDTIIEWAKTPQMESLITVLEKNIYSQDLPNNLEK